MPSKTPNLYCVKCKKRTPNSTTVSRLFARNGTPMVQTKCPVCGIKKTQFVKAD